MSPRPRREFGKITRMRSGNYQASYVAPDGQRYNGPQTFRTRSDADGWLATQRAAIQSQTWTQQTPMHPAAVAAQLRAVEEATKREEPTLGEYALRWVAERRSSGQPLAAKTQSEYRRYIERDFESLRHLKLSAITTSVVEGWYEEKRKNNKLALLENTYSLLNTVMGSAAADSEIPLVVTNPCEVAGAATVYSQQHKHDLKTKLRSALVTTEQLTKMLEAVDDRFRAAVLIGAWLGLRSGELRELRRKDILVTRNEDDEPRIVVHVKRSVTTPGRKHIESIKNNLRTGQELVGNGYVVGPTKWGSGERMILVPPHITGDILRHLEQYVGPGPEALLYTARKDARRHLSHSSFAAAWYPARAAAGRSDVPFHGLRHFAATEFALAGATIRELMERLGHSSVDVAMIYQQVSEERESELAAKMSARVAPRVEKAQRPTSDDRSIADQLAELKQLILAQPQKVGA